MMRRRRWAKTALLLGCILTLPLLALPIVIIGATAAFGVFFQAEFTLVNESAETVWITPVGKAGSGYAPLRRYVTAFPLIRAFKLSDFRLAPRASMDLIYDDDDIHLEGIVVRTRTGQYHWSLVRSNRPLSGAWVIRVPPTSMLPDADDTLVAAVEAKRFETRLWGLMLLGLVPVTFFGAWIRFRTASRAQ